MPPASRISALWFIVSSPRRLAGQSATAQAAPLYKVHSGNVTGKEHWPVRHDRPPGAPSASPAIADKAEKQESRGKRAQGLARESGRTGDDDGLARLHG